MRTFQRILSFLLSPFSWEPELPLTPPDHLEWNPSLSPQAIQIRGQKIFYVAKGEGEPIILIHGYGAGLWVWEKQIDVLSQAYRVYGIDVIGHGFSERPRIAYTPDLYIQFMKDFIEAMGIERASLVGNSMGGGIAWATAGHFPSRVKKLVLIDCVPPDVLDQVHNDSFRLLRAARRFSLLPYLVLSHPTRSLIRGVLEECVVNPGLITPEVVERQYRLSKIKGTSWVLFSTFQNADKALGLRPFLARITHPTLLLWGEKDLVFPPTVGEDLHRAIAGSRFITIKGSGHLPMWEAADVANPAILEFLRDPM